MASHDDLVGLLTDPWVHDVIGKHFRFEHKRRGLALVCCAEVEDLRSETYVRALRAKSRFNPGDSGVAWLKKIAARVVLDALRRRPPERSGWDWDVLECASRREHAGGAWAVRDDRRRPASDWEEDWEELEAAMSKMPARRRRAIRGRHLAGMSYSDLARSLGLASEKAARDETCRARRELRIRLGVSQVRPAGGGKGRRGP